MLKKVILIALCMLPLVAFAQTFKFVNVNSGEIVAAMPENANIQKEMEAVQKQYETEFMKMQEEFQRKYQEYMSSRDSLPQNINERRVQELEAIQQRVQTFQQQAQQDLQRKEQELVVPMIEKVRNAITEVGKENNFTYIFDKADTGILYFSEDQTIDVLPLVKAKLGLK